MSSHYRRQGADIFAAIMRSKKGKSSGDGDGDLILLIGPKLRRCSPFPTGPLLRLSSAHLRNTTPIRAPVKTTALSQVSTNQLHEKEARDDWLPARCRLHFRARFPDTCHANEGLSVPAAPTALETQKVSGDVKET